MTKATNAPAQCPLCHTRTGKPYKVVFQDSDDRRILMRCEACGHRWSQLEPLPPEFGEQVRR